MNVSSNLLPSGSASTPPSQDTSLQSTVMYMKPIVTIEFDNQVRGSGGKMSRYICYQSDCKRRVTLAQREMICKCQGIFCDRHRLAEKHACSFDYKAFHQAQLEQSMKASKNSKTVFTYAKADGNAAY